jgi:hypothetical protein
MMKAFPGTPTFDKDANRTVWQEGMDLRDYFAAKAMQNFSWIGENNNECAVSCYEIADAMMEARNGSQ